MRKLNRKIRFNRLLHIAIIWNIAFCFTCGIYANPVLNNVASGNVSITQTGTTTVVNQSSQKAIINWNSFNIGKNESTHFNQVSGGVALNRINPNQGASQIYGQLSATGQIILVNPAGIFFGPGSYVNVGGMIATTQNIRDSDFLANYYHFENNAQFAGAVINQGTIIAADHGLVALVGNNVSNEGLIQANMGKVVMASGEATTMNFSGNQLISFTVDTASTKNATDENGHEMRDGVKNTGTISANGGGVYITARAAQGVLDHAINLEGVVETKSVQNVNGEIILSGDMNGGVSGSGVVRLAGTLDASGKNTGETGGKIEATSQYILTESNARLDVSGDAGGGIIRLGGNIHGEGSLENATANVIMSGAVLNANAITSGNGGEVVVWANDVTRYYGEIYARGGASFGNGGFVEVSGKNLLDFNGQVNTTAANGQRGMLLLDPKNIIIAVSGSSSYSAGVNNLFANDSSGDSIIDPNSLNIGSDITLQANNDITVTDAINMTGSGNALYLQAGRDININNNITVNGNLYATANDTNALVANRDAGAGDITLASGMSINVGSYLAQLTVNSTGTGGFTPGTIVLNSGSAITAGTATLSTLNAASNGAITITGNIAASSAINISYGATSTVAGVLGGNGSLNIQGSAGTLTLSGANTYTGATNINSGTLRAGAANVLSDSTAVTVASGATYNLNNFSDTIGSLAGAGSVSLGSATLSTGGNNTSTNYSGVMSGTGGLTKQGTGTMNISGANTYTGTTSIQNGVLQLGANQTLGAVSLTNGSGVSLDLNNYNLSMTNLSGGGSLGGGVNIGSGTLTMAPTNNSYTFAGGFSGNGNIIKNGIYRLDVGGSSSFTGTTTINGGTLRTTTSSALGTSGSTILVNSGGNLTAWYQSIVNNVQLNGGTLQISQDGGVTGNVTLLADSNYAAAGIGTISGSISGNHNLTVSGGYYLYLTGDNSGFTGGLTLNSANTYIQNVNGLGSSTITLNGGILLLRSQLANQTLNNNIIVNNDSSAVYVQTGTVTLNGALSGSAIFNKGQAGALTLSGDNSAFTGAINIANGTLTATHANALGSTAGGVTIASGAILEINNVAIGNEAITNNGGSIVGTGTASSAGNITLGANSTVSGTGDLTLSGVIDDGVNTYNLTKSGAGSVTLSGANTYDGTTNITVGTLIAANNNALGSTTGGTTLSSGAVLNLNNAAIGNETITTGGDSSYSISSTGNSSLSGNIILGANSIFGGDGNLTLTGIISDGGNNYSIYKQGTGTLTLSGVNTYTGTTVVNAGVLSLTASNIIDNASSINVTSGGTLDFNFNNAIFGNTNTITLSGTGNSNVGAMTFTGTNVTLNNAITLADNSSIGGTGSGIVSGIISGSYGVTKVDVGTLTLNAENTYTGATNIDAGTLSYGVANALSDSTAVTVAAGATYDLGTYSDTIGSLAGAGNVTLTGVNLTTGGDNTDTTFSGVIDGTGGLIKTGSGAFTLSGANTYSGGTTLSAGTLNAGNSASLGTGDVALNAGALQASNAGINIANNMTLAGGRFDGNNNFTLSGVLSGGTLTKSGANTLILTGTNTYTNGTTINNGVLSVAADAALGAAPGVATTGQITLNGGTLGTTGTFTLNANRGITLDTSGGTFDVASGTTLTYAGIIAGSGALNTANTGTLSLSGANTYTGATNINAGTLRTTIANALSDATAVTVASGATYNLNNFSDTIGSLAGAGSVSLGSATLSTGGDNTSTNYSGVMSGTGGLTKQGTGTMNISGANSYTGTTSVQNGVLQLGSNQSLRTISMTNASGVSLDLNNFNLSATNLTGGGALGGGVNIGSGTLTVAPTNNSYIFYGGFTGNGNIIKNGIYELGIGGTSSFTGTSTINAGTLHTYTSTGLGAAGSTIVINSGSNLTAWYQTILSNLQLNGGTLQISQSAGVSGSVTLLADSSYTAAGIGTISGNISGNYNLTVGGGYYLHLTGNNSGFTGGLILNSADTYVESANALGSSTITLNGGNLLFRSQVANNTFTSNFNVNSSSSNVQVQSGTVTLSGGLSGSSTFNKGQTGALTLSGDNSAFSGAINITGGTLTAAHANALGDTSNGVTIASGAVLGINGVAIGNEAITNNGGSITGTGTASLSGNILLGANSTINGTGSLTLSGVIDDGINNYQLTKSGTGTVYLTNTNTYSGNTVISGGVLAINNSNSLGSGNISLGAGTLQSNAGGINLANNISFTSSSATLSGTNDYTLSGVLSGTTGLIKSGASNITITGANNSWSGTKYINAGSIIANNNTALGTGTISVASGATLSANNVNLSNALSLAGTGNAGLGALYTSGTVNLSGAVTLTGDTLVSTATGSDTLNFSNTINGARALTLSGGGTATLGGSVGNTTSLTSLISNNALNLGTASATNVYKTTGAQLFNSSVNYLGASATHTASSINYTSAVTGSNTALTATASSGSLTLNNGATLKSLAATGSTGIYINNADVTTTNGQTYNNAVTLSRNTIFTMNGSGTNTLSFLNGVNGGYATTLQGTGSGNYNFSLAGNLTGTYNVLGTSGGNNTLTVSSGNFQTININTLNAGTIASNSLGGLTFSNIQNITGGASGNKFVFANNATVSGTVDGGSLSNGVTNTLDYTAYTNALKVTFSSFNAGNVKLLSNLSQVALFNRINNIQNASTPNNSSITLSSQSNQRVTIGSSMTGNIVTNSGTVNFSNFQNMTSINDSDSVTITPNTGGVVNYNDKTATYSNGVMSFIGFSDFDTANQPSSSQAAQIVNQPETSSTPTDTTSDTSDTSAVATTTLTSASSSSSASSTSPTTTQPLEENTQVLVGPACY